MLASIVELFERDFITVDWDARTLRIVQAVAGKRNVEIVHLLSAPIPPQANLASAEAIGRLIRRTLDEKAIATRRMIVDIPRDQAVFNTLTVPKASPNELPSVVEFQVTKELPFPLAEAVVDFAIGSEDADAGTCEVLVAAVRNEVLEFYRQVALHAGLKLERVGLRPYASTIAVTELLRQFLPERVLFVDVGPVLTEIDLIRQGRLMFSRAASVAVPILSQDEPAPADEQAGTIRFPGISPETERAAVVRALLVEVTRSIEAYRARDAGAVIDHVVVGGSCGIEDELAEALQKRLNATAEAYNPARVFGWDPDRGAGACAFAATLGLALGHAAEGRLQIDFIHPKKAVTRGREQLQRAPLAAVAAVLLCGAGVVFYFKSVRPQYAELARIQKAIETGKKQKAAQDELAKLVQEAESYDRGQIVWVDALRDLIESIPDNKEVVIGRIDMSQRERSINLKINAKQASVGDAAVAALDEFHAGDADARRFEAKLRQRTETSAGNYPHSGQIVVTVLGGENARGKAAAAPRRGER